MRRCAGKTVKSPRQGVPYPGVRLLSARCLLTVAVCKLHRVREMQTIVIDDPVVCLSVAQIHCANTAERINVPCGVETLGALVDTSPSFPQRFHVAFVRLRCRLFLS